MKALTKRGNLKDPREKARILMRYAGIFPDDIEEYAKKIIRKRKPKVNYSR